MVAPTVLWAQRSSETDADRNLVFLDVAAPDLDPSSVKLEITGTKLSFSGHTAPPTASGTASKVEPKTYEFDLELFAEVEELKRNLTGKSLSLVLKKKEAQEDYWPRLTKEKVKLNWLKTDFSKWKDQDEQEDEEVPELGPEAGMGGMGGMGGMPGMGGAGGAGGMDFASMMQGMGGGGAGGMGGMGGGEMDFEKMMAQMKAQGMGGLGGEGDEEEEGAAAPEEGDDEDDGPPPLENA